MSTPLIIFIAIALLLTLLVLAILFYPLLKKPMALTQEDRRQAKLAIFRDQLQELERDRDHGLLAVEDFAQAQSELQRRLLDEVPGATTTAVSPAHDGKNRRTLLALGLMLPLASLVGYLLLGNPQAIDPAAVMQQQEHAGAQEIDGMLRGLAERLKANPDDHQGWIMLARSYKALGRFAESAEAYPHGGPLLEGDAALLADYAEVMARANQGRFDEKSTARLNQALKLNPDDAQALFLAGIAAEQRHDFAVAVSHWQHLLKQLEPGTEEASSLAASIAELQAMLGTQDGTSGKAGKKAK